MKAVLFLTVFLTALSFSSARAAEPAAAASASSYQLKLELAVNGKHVASPTMVLEPDQKAVVSQKGEDGETYILEVIATPQEKKTVKLAFAVLREVDGKPQLISNAGIVTKERKGATITVNKSDGSEQLSLKVWAKRLSGK